MVGDAAMLAERQPDAARPALGDGRACRPPEIEPEPGIVEQVAAEQHLHRPPEQPAGHLAQIEDAGAQLHARRPTASTDDMIRETRLHRRRARAMGGGAAGRRQAEPHRRVVVDQGHLGGAVEQGGDRLAVDRDGDERPVVDQLHRLRPTRRRRHQSGGEQQGQPRFIPSRPQRRGAAMPRSRRRNPMRSGCRAGSPSPCRARRRTGRTG